MTSILYSKTVEPGASDAMTIRANPRKTSLSREILLDDCAWPTSTSG